ncbi:DNA-binding anti-repressor SinI [Bacillus megaterium]|nr:DNA-binding anti-repressor SinI [Priestia megaterium]
MNRNEKENILSIDQEWVSLMESARKLGLTIEEVRKFLSELKQN